MTSLTLRWARQMQAASFYVLVFLLPISKAAIEISFWPLFLGWVWERLQPAGWRSSVWAQPRLRAVRIALVLFLGVCAVSILCSTFPAHSLRGFVGKTLQYALFTVCAADVVQWIRLEHLWMVIGSSAFLVGLDAVIQEIIGRDPILGHVPTVYGRMTGPYENPSDLATYLSVILLMALAFLRYAWRAAGPRLKLGLPVLVLLLGACLVRTESQSAWIGFGVGLALLVAYEPGLRKVLGWLAGGLILAAGVLLFVEHRLLAVITFTDPGVKDRWYMWQAGWRMVCQRPVMGLGLNTFMANYLSYWVGGEQQPRYAHNCYLQMAAETGFIGLGIFLALLVVFFRQCRHGLHLRSDAGLVRSSLLGLLAALTAFAVQAAADTNFYALRQATLFWTLAGVAMGLTVRPRSSHA